MDDHAIRIRTLETSIADQRVTVERLLGAIDDLSVKLDVLDEMPAKVQALASEIAAHELRDDERHKTSVEVLEEVKALRRERNERDTLRDEREATIALVAANRPVELARITGDLGKSQAAATTDRWKIAGTAIAAVTGAVIAIATIAGPVLSAMYAGATAEGQDRVTRAVEHAVGADTDDGP